MRQRPRAGAGIHGQVLAGRAASFVTAYMAVPWLTGLPLRHGPPVAWYSTLAAVRAGIDRAAAELRALTSGAGRWLRPIGTPLIRQAAVRAGYGACLAAGVRPGSIVSLHLGHAGTVQAMPAMLDVLRSRGLTAVTASRLLAAS